MSPKVGLMAPNRWTSGFPSPSELEDVFRRAEDWGFHSLWVTDRLLHPDVPMLHAFSLLTLAATATSTMRLGTAVYMLTLRHPVDVARQAMSIDYLSGGRLNLGVSLGGSETEYEAMNAPKRYSVSRFEESMTVLQQLWSGDPVTFEGKHFTMNEATILPRPIQEGGIPLLIGAGSRSDAGLKRAGRIGDGWIMGTPGTSPDDFAHSWRVVTESAVAAGRDPNVLVNAKLIYVNPHDDPVAGKEEIERELRRYYNPAGDAGGPATLQHAVVAGPPEVIAEQVTAYSDVGCHEVLMFFPWFDIEKLTLLARVVELVA